MQKVVIVVGLKLAIVKVLVHVRLRDVAVEEVKQNEVGKIDKEE